MLPIPTYLVASLLVYCTVTGAPVALNPIVHPTLSPSYHLLIELMPSESLQPFCIMEDVIDLCCEASSDDDSLFAQDENELVVTEAEEVDVRTALEKQHVSAQLFPEEQNKLLEKSTNNNHDDETVETTESNEPNEPIEPTDLVVLDDDDDDEASQPEPSSSTTVSETINLLEDDTDDSGEPDQPIMRFDLEQSQQFKFPEGCPVTFSKRDKFYFGTVKCVEMNMNTTQMRYTVTPQFSNKNATVHEECVQYAPDCPVWALVPNLQHYQPASVAYSYQPKLDSPTLLYAVLIGSKTSASIVRNIELKFLNYRANDTMVPEVPSNLVSGAEKTQQQTNTATLEKHNPPQYSRNNGSKDRTMSIQGCFQLSSN